MEVVMSIGKFAWGGLVPTLLVAVAGAYTQPASAAEQCVFDRFSVTSVAPYRTEESDEYASYTRLSGAQLYVPAREGLTPEWLTLTVQSSLETHADAQADGNQRSCSPDVKDVKVSVLSVSGGFWVRLTTNNEHAAAALLRWATTMASLPTHHASASQ
jgi:hypothetical protein